MKNPLSILFLVGVMFAIVVNTETTTNAQSIEVARMLDTNRYHSAARQEALGVLQAGNTTPEAFRIYLKNAIVSGKAKSAIPYADQFVSLYPRPHPRAWQAKCYFAAGEFTLAQSMARALIANPVALGWTYPDVMNMLDPMLQRKMSVAFTFEPSDVPPQSMINGWYLIPIPVASNSVQISQIASVEGLSTWHFETLAGQLYIKGKPDLQTSQIKIYADVQLEPGDFTAAAQIAPWGYPADYAVYTKPSMFIDSQDPEIVSIAATLKRPTVAATVNETLSWCQENLHYISPGVPDQGGFASAVIQRGWGQCAGLTMAAEALLRANDIPCRMLRGHGAFIGDDGHGSHHSILEFYVEGVGWIQWDYGQQPFITSANYLTMFLSANPHFAPEVETALQPLAYFQRTGLNCEYVWFDVQRRQ